MNDYEYKLKLVQDWMAELLPSNWTLRISSRAKRYLGCASPRTQTITMNQQFIKQATTKEVEDIVLHEIAHAQCFIHLVSAGHESAHFKQYCKLYGTGSDRIVKTAYKRQYKYTMTCLCGTQFKRDRIKKSLLYNYSCKHCGRSLSEAKITEN